MSYQADNAIIMAAGTSSRFAPLSYEVPKALVEVRGEILIERQIRQILDAGIPEVIVVTGYKGEELLYLRKKFGVRIVENRDYLARNNSGSLHAAREYIRNSYICSSDNYFSVNPFEKQVEGAYYAAVYAEGHTEEWCMEEDENGYISGVTIGGENAWYMLGHTFWDEAFSRQFFRILDGIYDLPETKGLLWESIFSAHLHELKMRMRRYPPSTIFEFDTLDELRAFDDSYVTNTRSRILRSVAGQLGCRESDIRRVEAYKETDNAAAGFRFQVGQRTYEYCYQTKQWREM